jgi:gluconokinase
VTGRGVAVVVLNDAQETGTNRQGAAACSELAPGVVLIDNASEEAGMVVVLMGVSGSGKSTVGKLFAQKLGWAFVEGDDYHPPSNVEKMREGTPLNDDDRRPWLAAIRGRVDQAVSAGEDIVLACSALKHAYQEYLERYEPARVHYVYLHGPEELIKKRLGARKGHFMNPGLLHSQFETLEPPADAVRVEVSGSPEEVADEVRRKLGL